MFYIVSYFTEGYLLSQQVLYRINTGSNSGHCASERASANKKVTSPAHQPKRSEHNTQHFEDKELYSTDLGIKFIGVHGGREAEHHGHNSAVC